jgi:hypothetical protein
VLLGEQAKIAKMALVSSREDYLLNFIVGEAIPKNRSFGFPGFFEETKLEFVRRKYYEAIRMNDPQNAKVLILDSQRFPSIKSLLVPNRASSGKLKMSSPLSSYINLVSLSLSNTGNSTHLLC